MSLVIALQSCRVGVEGSKRELTLICLSMARVSRVLYNQDQSTCGIGMLGVMKHTIPWSLADQDNQVVNAFVQWFDGYKWWLKVARYKVKRDVVSLCRVSREPSKQNMCNIQMGHELSSLSTMQHKRRNNITSHWACEFSAQVNKKKKKPCWLVVVSAQRKHRNKY